MTAICIPREYGQQFKSMIAKEEGVTKEHILLGAGSSELRMPSSRLVREADLFSYS